MIDEAALGAILEKIMLELATEGYEGPDQPKMTWFVDNERSSGVLGTLATVGATKASRALSPSGMSIAAHAAHLRFSLNLANRALRGEDVHSTADWKTSWVPTEVDDVTWAALVADLRHEFEAFREAIRNHLPMKDEMTLCGALGQIAHGAWHLGALRQGLGLISRN